MELIKTHEQFCRNFVECNDGPTAALCAGYDLKVIERTAEKLLGIKGIRDRIKELGGDPGEIEGPKPIAIKTAREKILAEWWKIAFFNPQEMYNPDGTVKPIAKMDESVAACLASYEVEMIKGKNRSISEYVTKIKIHDKLKALDALGRAYNMFDKPGEMQETYEHMSTERLKELFEQAAQELGLKRGE
jgi:hypothetical protein